MEEVCDGGNELSDSVKFAEILDYLQTSHLLKKDF